MAAQSNRCTKCGSGQVIANVRIPDYHSHLGDKTDLVVEIYDNPDSLLFKGKHQGKLTARVCGQCGFAELFVSNPQKLWKIYRESVKDQEI